MTKSPKFLKLAKSLQQYSLPDFKKILRDDPENTKTLVMARSYYDLEFFADYFFSHKDEEGQMQGHTKDPFNKMHLTFFKKFKPVEKSLHKVILASRGSAKTTLVCLIYVLHKICFNNEKYILILSSTTPYSRQKSKEIHLEIRNNEVLKDVFDLKFEGNKRTSAENFVVESVFGRSLVSSQSFNSEIRGAKWEGNRLTLVILDDVVHGEEVFSEAQREKMMRKLKTDIMQASQPGTNFIYIGTKIHDQDLGSELSRDPSWDFEIYPAFEKWPDRMDLWTEWEEIIKDPTKTSVDKMKEAESFYQKNKEKMTKGAVVLWPEREDTYYLMKERLKVGRREFGAEKQMIAFLTGESLFEDITYFYPKEIDGKYGFYLPKQDDFIEYNEARFIKYYAIDPATGEEKKQTQQKTLSKSARVIAARDQNTGTIYILDVYMDRKGPLETIEEMYDLHHHHNFYRMYFEENLFRDVYKGTIDLVGKEWNKKYSSDIKLPTHSIWNSVKKEERIYGLEPHIHMAKIIINKHANPKFLTQLETYPNSDHNDGLDAVQILWQGIHSKGFRRL